MIAVFLCLQAPSAGAASTISDSDTRECTKPFLGGEAILPCRLRLDVTLSGGECDADDVCYVNITASATGEATHPGIMTVHVEHAIGGSGGSTCIGPQEVRDKLYELDPESFTCNRMCSSRAVGTSVACGTSVIVPVYIARGTCEWIGVTALLSHQTISGALTFVSFKACRPP